ncbi:MAG: sulfotransferase domain-containing protein [Acidimicrobiales bacterium]|nr:sulfotransferase domain-containing protein [Acidimicrobiales bacterium]
MKQPVPYDPPPVPRRPLAALSKQQRAALPNLIVIGAAKCGTTALHRYLSLHPEIAMSQRKELMLFGGNRWLERLGWYADQFDASDRVRGEASPSYTMDPFVPDVVAQMDAVLPSDTKFIYIVGDPIPRVVAHWGEQHGLGNDERTLDDALRDLDPRANPYLAASRYGHHLGLFGARPVHVVDQADLRDDRRTALRALFAFVGVDDTFCSDGFDDEHNTAATKIERPLLSDESTAALRDYLTDDIARFRGLTGRDFAHWSL